MWTGRAARRGSARRVVPRSPSEEHLARHAAQQRVLRRFQVGVARDNPLGLPAGALKDLGIPWQLRDAELRDPVLAGPDQLTLAAQLEIDLGEFESIRMRRKSP